MTTNGTSQTAAQNALGDFAPKLVDLTDEVLFGDVRGVSRGGAPARRGSGAGHRRQQLQPRAPGAPDFTLTPEEVAAIDALDTGARAGSDPERFHAGSYPITIDEV